MFDPYKNFYSLPIATVLITMRLLSILLFAGYVICRPSNEDQPTFNWISDRSAADVPLLKVTFPVNGDVDFAHLTPFNPIPVSPLERSDDVDNCIYDGYLHNEKDVYVTLTGCPMADSFQVQFKSNRLKNTMFHVVKGKVVPFDFSHERMLERDIIDIGTTSDSNRELRLDEPLSPIGYTATVKLYFDGAWKDLFKDNSVNVARRVMAHAQNPWRWSSLTTKVIFLVDPEVKQLPGKWSADFSLDEVSKANSIVSVNSNIFFCVSYDIPNSSTFGRAYLGGACTDNPYWHGVIMEYDFSDLIVARSLAHEIGHNLGMDHDFIDDRNNPRFDSKGKNCLGQGGLMDYSESNENDKSGWSTCSIEFLTSQLNTNKTCLKKIDSAKPPTSPAPPDLTDNECDISKKYPNLNGVHELWLNGIQRNVYCMNGICTTKYKDKNGCPMICGQPNCKDAVDPGFCDLTSQLKDFSGEQELYLSGIKSQVVCTLGKCRPIVYGGYSDPCKEICQQSSCANAKDPGFCDLTNQLKDYTGEKYINLNGYYKKVNCLSGKCRPVKSVGYSDPCMEICNQSSCLDAKDPGECDLTRQLGDFTGEKKFQIDGYSANVACTNGKCRSRYEGYTDSCTKICGQPSCKDSELTQPCDVTKFVKPIEEQWPKLCLNGVSGKWRCTLGMCTPIDPPYKNACMAICNKQSCDDAQTCTYVKPK